MPKVATRRRPRGRRPSLEVLEDRITPASRLFAVPVGGNEIVELNPTTGAVINSFAAPDPAPSGEAGLAFDGTRLFYLNGGISDRLYELNPDTGAILDSDPITGGSGGYDSLAVVAGEVYIQDYAANQILVLQPATDTVVRVLSPGVDLLGGLAGASAPGALIGLINGGDTVVEINPATGAVTHSFPTGIPFLFGAAVVGDEIYLGSALSNTIFRYSRSGTPLGEITTPNPVFALASDDTTPAPGPGTQFVNGNFETGNLFGWTFFNDQLPQFQSPGFQTYTGPNPQGNSNLPAPPQGNFAAFNSHFNPGTYILYQDVVLTAGQFHTLSLQLYYNNVLGQFVTPDTLSAPAGGAPNQQFRVDVISPAGDLLSTGAGTVLHNVFRTDPGEPAVLAPVTLSADLSALAGQTVRLRIAVANNQNFLFAGVDDVKLVSSATPPAGTVSGVKYHDLDGDGTRDAGEPGLPGWTIYADLNNNRQPDGGEPSVVTGADGSYTLTVSPGTYALREVAQTGWVQTSPLSYIPYATGGNGTQLVTINTAAGTATVVGPFGTVETFAGAFTPDGTFWTIIHGFDAGQARLARVDLATGVVTPVGSPNWTGSPIIALEADAAGNLYGGSFGGQFFRIDKTTGAATLVGPLGFFNVMDFSFDRDGVLWAVGNNNLLFRVNPSTGAGTFVASISGTDGGEVMGLMVHPGTGTFYATTYTFDSALYTLNPATGAATRVGSVLGTQFAHGGDFGVFDSHSVTVAADQDLTAVDFGNQRDEGTVSGVKFNDLDGDRVRDPGEPGLSGWTIYADLNRNGRLDAGEPSTVTGADGSYALTLPSGSYTLREVAQAGWVQTSPTISRLFAVRSGSSGTTPTIEELDASGAVLNSFAAPAPIAFAGPQGLADAGGSLFYIDGSQAGAPPILYELDPFTGAVRDSDFVLAGSPVSGLAWLNGLVYLSSSNSPQIVVFDPVLDTIVRTLTPGPSLVGGLTGAGDLGLLFASTSGQIVGIDPQTGAIVRTLSPSGVPTLSGGLAYSGGELIGVWLEGPNPVFRIDPETGAVLGTINLGGTARVTGLGGDGPVIGPHLVTVSAGSVLAGRDFGNRQDVGTVSGVKFNDLDGNGVRDPGEPGLSGWTIYADLNNNRQLDAGEPSVVTGADGSYALTLPSGSHILREVAQPGWVQTSPTVSRLFAVRGGPNNTTPTIHELNASGAILRTFAAPAPVPFAGPQGLADAGDSLFYIDGALTGLHTLYELDPLTGAVLDSDALPATPEIAGLAYLGGLVYVQVYPTDEILVFDPVSDTIVRRFNVPADLLGGLTGAADLGLLFGSNASGQVFAIHPQTGAVVRTLIPNTGPLNGGLAYYNRELIGMAFGVGPAFRIDPETGAVLGNVTLGGVGPVAGLGGDGVLPRSHRVTVATGQTLPGVNFGNRQDVGTVSGIKYNDLDGDGVRDAGEPGLGGWTIYADLNRNGRLDAGEPSTVTAADGSYALTLPSGTHALREVAQAGWVQTSSLSSRLFAVRSGPNGAPSTVHQLNASGAVVTTFFTPVPVQVPGAQGLADGGNSLFYINGSQLTGGTGPHTLYELDPFTGAVLDSDVLPATTEISGLASLGGLVYVLTSGSNQILVFDPVLDVVVRTLTAPMPLVGGLTGASSLGLLFASTTTGQVVALDPQVGALVRTLNTGLLNGGLAFLNGELIAMPFGPPNPAFRIDPQTGAVLGTLTLGGIGPVAGLGGDGAVIVPQLVTVSAGGVLAGRDFGNRQDVGTVSGVKFNDLDGDGVRDAGEPGLSGWTIYADLNNNRQPDAGEPSVLTGPDGSYSLTLPSGNHNLREVVQSGWRQTSPTAGSFFAVRVTGPTPVIFRLGPTGAVLTSFLAPAPVPFAGRQGLAEAGGSLFYIDGTGTGPHTLYELDSTTGAVLDADALPATADIDGLAYLGGLVYAQVDLTNEILVFDPASDTLVRRFTVTADIAGGLTGVGDHGLLYANNVNGAIFGIDPVTGAVVRTLVANLGPLQGGLAYLGGELIAAPLTTSSLAFRVNPNTGALLGTITLGGAGVLSGLGGDGAASPHRLTVAAGLALNNRDFGNRLNSAPTAVNDTVSVGEDPPFNVPAPGVLANDTDADPIDTKIVTAVNGSATAVGQTITLASGARLTLRADGSYTYNPNGQFNALRAGQTATDSFAYTMKDGQGATSSATVTVTINGANDAPTAVPDSFTTDEDTQSSGNVLANDVDPDQGDTRTVVAVIGQAVNVGQTITLASGARLRVNADGTFTYDPRGAFDRLRPGQTATDSFDYTMADSGGVTRTTVATFTITGVNDAPVAGADTESVDEDGLLSKPAPGVLANDTDLDQGDSKTVTAVEGAAANVGQEITLASGARLLLRADGSYVYNPQGAFDSLRAGETATETITYVMADALGVTSTAVLTITVNGLNDRPVAVDDTGTTNEDSGLLVGPPGLLGNDTDADHTTTLTIIRVNTDGAVGQPITLASGAVLTVNADGSYTYNPNGRFEGLRAGQTATDSFTYLVSDGTAMDEATVTITIMGINDAPVAVADAYTTDEDVTLSVQPAQGVLANDTDVDSLVLTAILVSGPSKGTLTLNPNGSLIYTPNMNVSGTDQFTYRASDGTLTSNVVTVTITINAVEDAPIAVPGPNQSANEAASVAFDGSGSSDADGDILTYTWDFGDGSTGTGLSPTHTYADNRIYIVTLTVDDGHGNSDSDTLVVTVDNVAPTAAVTGPSTGVRGQTRTFRLTAVDVSSVDQDAPFTYAINWGDGTPAELVQGMALTDLEHVFIATGTFTVTVTAIDKDGGPSTPVSATITALAVELQGTVLIVGGTPGGDTILIKPANTNGSLTVNLNGVNLGTFKPTGRVIVYAQAGNDVVRVQDAKIQGKTYAVKVPAFLFGGDGNDTLDTRGSGKDNVLAGGDGADLMRGSEQSDLLLGGLGADTVEGGAGDDIVIGAKTAYDAPTTASLDALEAIMQEWTQPDVDYVTRRDNVLGSGLLSGEAVLDDGLKDVLSGDQDRDWFFARLGTGGDALQDRKSNETVTSV